MNSKQRSKLKSMAQNLNVVIQIGKNGVTSETIKVVMDAFNTRELIKINVIEACQMNSREVANILSLKTHSEVVQTIGKKVILYKKKPIKKVKNKGTKKQQLSVINKRVNQLSYRFKRVKN